MATKRNWLSYAKKWYERFALYGNEIEYRFNDGPIVFDDGIGQINFDQSNKQNTDQSAMTTSLPTYKKHCIDINLQWLKKATPKQVDETVCHELLHIKNSPTINVIHSILKELPEDKQVIYERWFRDTNEVITSELAAALSSLYVIKNKK